VGAACGPGGGVACKWLKSRPESGLDCLICAVTALFVSESGRDCLVCVARQRSPETRSAKALNAVSMRLKYKSMSLKYKHSSRRRGEG